uniref:Uncharacterized protein n=1 Tax=Cacopsylla melanoneura TaxID=428564 RepID=A0A8D9FJ35_9HEMI
MYRIIALIRLCSIHAHILNITEYHITRASFHRSRSISETNNKRFAIGRIWIPRVISKRIFCHKRTFERGTSCLRVTRFLSSSAAQHEGLLDTFLSILRGCFAAVFVQIVEYQTPGARRRVRGSAAAVEVFLTAVVPVCVKSVEALTDA